MRDLQKFARQESDMMRAVRFDDEVKISVTNKLINDCIIALVCGAFLGVLCALFV